MIVRFQNLIKKINRRILQNNGDYFVFSKILNEKAEKKNGSLE